jgi:putative transposase
MHCVITLPPGDDDFSNRIQAMTICFVQSLPPTEGRSSIRMAKGECGIWQRRFWEHAIRDEGDYALHMDYVHFNPSNMVMYRRLRTGPTRHFFGG